MKFTVICFLQLVLNLISTFAGILRYLVGEGNLEQAL